MESGFDLLVERGFVYQSSNDQALRAALTRPTRGRAGETGDLGATTVA